MKAFLMHRDRDFDLERALPANEAVLAKNLELDTLFAVMAAKDPLVLEVAKKAILASVFNDVAVIEYRQAALKDCLSNPDIVRQLYGLAVELAERQRKIWSTFREYPSGLLDTSVQRMVAFRRRAEANAHAGRPQRRSIPVRSVHEISSPRCRRSLTTIISRSSTDI